MICITASKRWCGYGPTIALYKTGLVYFRNARMQVLPQISQEHQANFYMYLAVVLL